ncbi:MAG: stalk domain-containing protein [Clostridia bacterium]|jgi:hypothetical protein
MIKIFDKFKKSISSFLHKKFIIVVITTVVVFCVVSAIICVQVTMGFFEIHLDARNETENKPSSALNNISIPAGIGGFLSQDLYINCEYSSDSNAYFSYGNIVLIPVDSILRTMGEKFKYFSSDDIISTKIKGKKLIIKLGEAQVNYDGKQIKLLSPAISSNNHIFISSDFTRYIDGVSVYSYPKFKTVFINYFPGNNKSLEDMLKILRIKDGETGVYNISGEKRFWSNKNLNKNDNILPSPDGSEFLLKTNGKTYLLDIANGFEKRLLNVDESAVWTQDGKCLCWTKSKYRELHVYNLRSNLLLNVGDYINKLSGNKSLKTASKSDWVLNRYIENGKYRDIIFTNNKTGINYVFLEENGEIVLEGKAVFSPDEKWVICFNDSGCSIASMNGDIRFITENKSAKWVNNDGLIFTVDGGSYLYSISQQSTLELDDNWNIAGKNAVGDVFYTRGKWLFTENNGVQNKRIKLPFACDYVYGATKELPYILAAKKEDFVYFLSDDKLVDMGKYSELNTFSKSGGDFSQSIISSSNKQNFIVFQLNKDKLQLSLNIISEKMPEPKRLTLNYYASNISETGQIKCKWISNNRLLIYTQKQGWIIDFSNKVMVYNWTEGANCFIKGII